MKNISANPKALKTTVCFFTALRRVNRWLDCLFRLWLGWFLHKLPAFGMGSFVSWAAYWVIQIGVAAYMANRMFRRETISAFNARGLGAWMLGVFLTGFYVVLYWYGEQMVGLVAIFDPLSKLVRNGPADQWFVYGTIYTVSVLVMGYKFALKYRHNRYQLIRTASVCFFQLGFSFLIPSF